MILGGLNGSKLEAWDSGAISDSFSNGDRKRVVSQIFQCFKHDAKTVFRAIDDYPDPLYTPGGRNANGTVANQINWGSDFKLDGVGTTPYGGAFSRLTASYKATNPTGGVAIAGVGDTDGCIIGGLHEWGEAYMEAPESGDASDSKIFLSDLMGWYVQRDITGVYICLRVDVRTILDAWDLTPTVLYTSGGSDTDGSLAARVNWGYGFEVQEIAAAAISPSFSKITVTYRKNIPLAVERPPSGMVIACSAGVCSLTWKGVLFERWDSELGVCNQGFEIVRMSDKEAQIRCNGIAFSAFEADTAGTHLLEWVISGNNAQLKYCGQIWKEYEAGA